MDIGSSPTSALKWTVLGLSAVAVYLCWPLWPALVLAAWSAELGRPLLARFDRGLHGRRRAAAALSVLLFVGLLLPLTLVTLGVYAGANDLAVAIQESSSAKSALEQIAAGDGAGSEGPHLPALPTTLPAALELAQQYGAQGFALLQAFAGAATKGLVALFIYFGGVFVFLVEGPAIWAWMQRNSPFEPRHLARFATAFHETGRGLLIGVGLTSATQGLVATLVYLGLGVPRWWVLGPITGVASMIPLVGVGLVWVPLAIGLFLTGSVAKAVILAVLGIGVIGTVDNLLRPVYSRMGALEMPTFLLYVSIFGGLAAFGTWGALLGPLVVRLWLEALSIRREGPSETQPPSTL